MSSSIKIGSFFSRYRFYKIGNKRAVGRTDGRSGASVIRDSGATLSRLLTYIRTTLGTSWQSMQMTLNFIPASNVNSCASEIVHIELCSAANNLQLNRAKSSEIETHCFQSFKERPKTDNPTSSRGRNPESWIYKGVRCDIQPQVFSFFTRWRIVDKDCSQSVTVCITNFAASCMGFHQMLYKRCSRLLS